MSHNKNTFEGKKYLMFLRIKFHEEGDWASIWRRINNNRHKDYGLTFEVHAPIIVFNAHTLLANGQD